MKCILRHYGIGMTTIQRQVARSQAADMTRTRGTARIPLAPRDILPQSAPRGVLLNWRIPDGFTDDIAGWRIYKDREDSLYAEIRDPNTTQHFVETTAGSAPPVTNFWVSAIGKLGQESPLVHVQGNALTESGAPTMPEAPPTYGKVYIKGYPITP